MTEFDSPAIDEAAMAEDARAAAALRHQRTVRGDPAGMTTFSPSGVTTDFPAPGQGDEPAETEANPLGEFSLGQFSAYRRGPLAGAARLAAMSDLARIPDTPTPPDQPDARTVLERAAFAPVPGCKSISTNGPVENGRVAPIVLGPPAAGKSTISKPLAPRNAGGYRRCG